MARVVYGAAWRIQRRVHGSNDSMIGRMVAGARTVVRTAGSGDAGADGLDGSAQQGRKSSLSFRQQSAEWQHVEAVDVGCYSHKSDLSMRMARDGCAGWRGTGGTADSANSEGGCCGGRTAADMQTERRRTRGEPRWRRRGSWRVERWSRPSGGGGCVNTVRLVRGLKLLLPRPLNSAEGGCELG